MSSHLVVELFKIGFNVVLGCDLKRGFPLDVEANSCSCGLQGSLFCYAQISVDGGGNSHPV